MEVGPVEPPVRGFPDRNDVINQNGRLTAAAAGGIGGEIIGAGLLPVPVIATRPRCGALGIVAGFPLPIARGHCGAALTFRVNATAVTTDAGSGAGHDQATGAW